MFDTYLYKSAKCHVSNGDHWTVAVIVGGAALYSVIVVLIFTQLIFNQNVAKTYLRNAM